MSHQFENRLLAAALAVLWGTALQAADPAPAQPAAAEVAADPQAPTAAPAQAPTAAPAQPGAAADTQALETVVVTARRREENLQQVPLAVTAVSGEALEQKGIQNLFDL